VEKGVPKFGISTYEQFQLVKVFFKLKQILPQFQIDGSHNLWIVKPSYTSCGFGIYCSRTLSTILPDIKRVQQKVVMKYIENPLLINSPQLPSRKFDFRQWVLVLSWEPLDICVFDSCYLKICGQDFDLKQFEDTLRHLSNYSLNKGSGKDLVMCTSEFE
jgi:tubulin monoglycylase TTLL3/8